MLSDRVFQSILPLNVRELCPYFIKYQSYQSFIKVFLEKKFDLLRMCIKRKCDSPLFIRIPDFLPYLDILKFFWF